MARRILDDGLSVRATEQMVHKATEEKPAKTPPSPRAEDPNIRAAENKLRRALGTQVKIHMSEAGRGRVEISFFNTLDLDRIYNLLTNHS